MQRGLSGALKALEVYEFLERTCTTDPGECDSKGTEITERSSVLGACTGPVEAARVAVEFSSLRHARSVLALLVLALLKVC